MGLSENWKLECLRATTVHRLEPDEIAAAIPRAGVGIPYFGPGKFPERTARTIGLPAIRLPNETASRWFTSSESKATPPARLVPRCPMAYPSPLHRMKSIAPLLPIALLAAPALSSSAEVQQAEMAGYLFAPAEKVPEEFNGGFSLYAAAWPLVEIYPGHKFQTGLCGTWMHPQWEPGHEPAGKCYTDIEGGLGWWRDTHFPTTSSQSAVFL
jgi:hypothetical protein